MKGEVKVKVKVKMKPKSIKTNQSDKFREIQKRDYLAQINSSNCFWL